MSSGTRRIAVTDRGAIGIAGRTHDVAGKLEMQASTVRLFQDITNVLMSDDQDLEGTIAYCLQRMCESHGWRVGHGVLRRGDAAESAWAHHVWHLTDPQKQAALQKATLEAHYENSTWMPDLLDVDCIRVVPDVSDEPGFKRTDAAKASGLRSLVLVPINHNGRVPAYLELFSDESIYPGPAMLDMLNCIATLMGQLIQKKMLDKAVSDSIWLMQQRVGRELHDNVCQDLVGLAYLGRELASSLMKADSEHAMPARNLVRDIDVCLDRARAISKGLCPYDCKAGELPRALGDLIEGSQRRFKIDFRFSSPHSLVLANDQQAQQLYYIAHEALTNVVKHSNARHVHVTLAILPVHLLLRIEDDGVGLARDHDVSTGIGIRVMSYRAETIGAKLRIESDPDSGTTLTCTLPSQEYQT